MSLPRGLAFEGTGAGKRVVPIAAPPDRFFDDPPEQAPVDNGSTHEEAMRAVVELLTDFQPKKAPIAFAALRKFMRYDLRPIREIAGQLSCPPATLQDAVSLIKKRCDEIKSGQTFRGNIGKKPDKTRIGREHENFHR